MINLRKTTLILSTLLMITLSGCKSDAVSSDEQIKQAQMMSLQNRADALAKSVAEQKMAEFQKNNAQPPIKSSS
jgi:hypothetical protein